MTVTRTIPAAPAANALKALLWMLLALLSFSLFAVAGREAGRDIDTLQIMMYRGPIGLAIVLAIGLATGARFTTKRLGMHSVRSLMHFGAQFSWLKALTLIPLVQLFALEFTTPLWVSLMAPLLLGEKLTRIRLLAALIGFIGMLVIVRPGSAEINTGTMLGLACAIGFAASMISTKTLIKTESPFTILFYMMVFQTMFGFAAGIWGAAWPQPATWGWLVVIALAGLSAHYALARAFQLADAIIVAPMDFLRLPLIAVVGIVLYAEPLDPIVLIGGVVVIAANLLNIWGERKSKPAA